MLNEEEKDEKARPEEHIKEFVKESVGQSDARSGEKFTEEYDAVPIDATLVEGEDFLLPIKDEKKDAIEDDTEDPKGDYVVSHLDRYDYMVEMAFHDALKQVRQVSDETVDGIKKIADLLGVPLADDFAAAGTATDG